MAAPCTRIPCARPSITEREIRYATDAAATGWGERCCEHIHRFEDLFRTYIGTAGTVATSCATGALHMGMSALGIGVGDEVILADCNWIATAAPIVHLGAKPVFVDILPDTWCVDPDKAEAAITPRTKAILAVHLYGSLCDMDRLQDIAARHKLALIEDAAEALGSRWNGRLAGSLGVFGAFSFHGSKTVSTGEGGMFVTNDQTLLEKVQTLANHGRKPGETRQYWSSVIGFKYKMSNLQAAVGCAQMERVSDLVSQRRAIFAGYRDRLADLPDLALNVEHPETLNSYWMPTVVFPKRFGNIRDELMQRFEDRNIDGRVFFHPLSSFDMFESVPENQNSYSISERAANLPSFHDITDAEMDRVVAVVKEQYHGR
jgi:perosamine synthetase